RDVLAHQGLDRLVGLALIRDLHAQQRTRLRVERRHLERPGVHLAEALEALDLDLVALAVQRRENLLTLGVVARPARLLADAEPIERRLRDVDVALSDEIREL